LFITCKLVNIFNRNQNENSQIFRIMSWEIQFRKKEADLDQKLTFLQNFNSDSDSSHLESEINNLLDHLNAIVNDADKSSAAANSSKLNW
jgi:hypothetical protein